MTSYANFNTVTFSGRVFNAELVNDEFLAVTVISNLSDGDEGVTVTFNNSNGMMGLFQKGYLPVGRQVTVVGRIKSVSETYLDKKSGQTKLRKRPNIHLEGFYPSRVWVRCPQIKPLHALLALFSSR